MIRKAVVAALALLAACSGEKPKDPARPQGYALNLTVTPAAGGSIQRIDLPAAALTALERPDAGDLRVFDGNGKVVSLAQLPADSAEALTATKVPAYPIEGAAAAPGASAVSVKVDVDADIFVSARRPGTQATSGPAALLFDTRKLADPVSAIELDADLPAGHPVEVTLESSSDLKDWEPLSSKVLFRGEAGQEVLGTTRIALGGAGLKDRYLRASWPAAPGVAVRGGTLFTAKSAPPAAIAIAAEGATLAGDHDARFALPIGYAPRAVRITGAGTGGVVPVRLYGRFAPERPWTGLAAGTLRDGKPAEIELTGFGYGEYKLEADQRSSGFAAAPKLELLFEPVVVIAALSGRPPYTLAVGNKAAPSAYFAPGELLGQLPISAELPKAKVALAQGQPVVQLSPAHDDGPFAPRKLALWAALLLATGVLAFAAIRLMKASATPPAG